ncbi:MAG: hypothetical protein KAW17_04555 [Candidatus Eisenbacteria sp.]|nr:hypothetical protein [Candidatus Eisenbacteria bacterium]
MRSRTATILAALLVLVGVDGGCGTRSRDNPLDPDNPGTGGTAPNFNAIAGDGEVSVNWSAMGIDDLEQVAVIRRVCGGVAETLSTQPGQASGWVDTSAVNGITYEYWARYTILEDPAVHLSNVDLATPGAGRVWVVDESWGGLRRVAPDARDLVWKLPYSGYFRSLAVDHRRGRAWSVAWSRNEVVGVDSLGHIVATVPTESPRTVAVYEEDGSIWVAAQWGVGCFTSSGDLLFADSTVTEPKDIAVDPARGTCWVAEGTGSIWIRHADGTTGRVFNFDYPFAISIAESDGGAWVVDAGSRQVYRLAGGAGEIVGQVAGFAQPVDVAASPSGGAWVADWGAGAVVWVSDVAERGPAIGGFDHPRGIAVGDSGNTVWVVEALAGRVTKVSTDADLRVSIGGLDFPKDIAIAR